MSAEDTVLRHVHACRRLWNHFLALCVKKDAAVIHGDAEVVAGIEETMRRVDRDLTTEERLLAVADKIERDGPKAWRSQSWASALVMAVLLAASTAWAQPVTPVQRGVLRNYATSGSNANATIAIAAITGLSTHVYQVSARCFLTTTGAIGGTAALTIFDGATLIWSSGLQGIASSLTVVNFTAAPLVASGTLTVTLGACGSNNSGILNVQADQY